MIRLILKRTYTCPDGAVTGHKFETVDLENAELENALLTTHGYENVTLVGAEARPAPQTEAKP